jgi:hypothetical protein
MHLLGLVLGATLLLAVIAALLISVRAPFVGLALLVAGMAVHNVALMAMLRLGTPGPLLLVVQAWKEIDIAVLAGVAAWRWWQGGRLRPSLNAIDWLVVAFAVVLVVYLLLPNTVTGGTSGLSARLLAFRVYATLIALYALGRAHVPGGLAQERRAAWILAGSAAAVGLAGVLELWFLPTGLWIDWGVNLYNAHLGYVYNGPAGLPANFFLTFPNGLLLRRSVSTYISPLGIAYTAILVQPIATPWRSPSAAAAPAGRGCSMSSMPMIALS